MSDKSMDAFRTLMQEVGVKPDDPALPAFQVVWVTAWQASRSVALEEALCAIAQARLTSHACDAIRSLDTQKRGE